MGWGGERTKNIFLVSVFKRSEGWREKQRGGERGGEISVERQARDNQGKPCNQQARVKGMSERKEVGRGKKEGNKKETVDKGKKKAERKKRRGIFKKGKKRGI